MMRPKVLRGTLLSNYVLPFYKAGRARAYFAYLEQCTYLLPCRPCRSTTMPCGSLGMHNAPWRDKGKKRRMEREREGEWREGGYFWRKMCIKPPILLISQLLDPLGFPS